MTEDLFYSAPWGVTALGVEEHYRPRAWVVEAVACSLMENRIVALCYGQGR